MKTRRLQEMAQLIVEKDSMTMEELCGAFNVSMNTIRRDVAELVRAGKVEKVYGGVRAVKQVSALIPYEERYGGSSAAKRAICAEAAKYVKDGDIVFIDSGTTTVHLMEALGDRNLTVITNNIEIILQALEMPSIRLIVLPGELHRNTHSITGDASADFLSRFNTNIAFMAATGVSEGGVTNSSPLEYSIKKTAVEHSERSVLMVTGNKFGVTSLLTYAHLDQFDLVITDQRISPQWKKTVQEKGPELIVSDE